VSGLPTGFYTVVGKDRNGTLVGNAKFSKIN
jgi:hypothetical protein